MNKTKSDSILVKSVRVRLDHIEKITQWLELEGYTVKYSTKGIDGEYYNYSSVDMIIEKKGIHPREVVVLGERESDNITVMFRLLYCVIRTDFPNSELAQKIRKLMRSSVRWIYRVISFKVYIGFATGFFVAYLISFFLYDRINFYWQYAVYLVFAVVLAAIFNNNVNNIYLIRAHEKIGMFHRIKDAIVKAILTAFIIVPIAPYISKLIKALYKYWPIQ